MTSLGSIDLRWQSDAFNTQCCRESGDIVRGCDLRRCACQKEFAAAAWIPLHHTTRQWLEWFNGHPRTLSGKLGDHAGESRFVPLRYELSGTNRQQLDLHVDFTSPFLTVSTISDVISTPLICGGIGQHSFQLFGPAELEL